MTLHRVVRRVRLPKTVRIADISAEMRGQNILTRLDIGGRNTDMGPGSFLDQLVEGQVRIRDFPANIQRAAERRRQYIRRLTETMLAVPSATNLGIQGNG